MPTTGSRRGTHGGSCRPPFALARSRTDIAPEYGEVTSTMRGYIQFLDEKTLMSAARRHTVIIRLAVRPGSFLFDGTLVCDVWPAERLTDEVARDILGAIATGARRTPADDMLFMVDELVEIAARALSPGVNDPYTAIGCIDWVSAALAEVASRPTPDSLRTDRDGKLRIVAEPLGFGEYLGLSLGAIREYAAGDKLTAVHFLRTIELVARRCTRGAQVLALTREAGNLVELSQTKLTGPSLREVEAEATIVRKALSHARRRRPFPELAGLDDRLAELPPPPKRRRGCSAVVLKEPELQRREILRRVHAEMRPCVCRQQPAARRALDEALLDEIGLDDVLDGVARFGQARRDRLDADRPAAEVAGDHRQVAPVELVETERVDLQPGQRLVGDPAVDRRRHARPRRSRAPASGDARQCGACRARAWRSRAPRRRSSAGS